MKKKWIIVLGLSCLLFGLSGCDAAKMADKAVSKITEGAEEEKPDTTAEVAEAPEKEEKEEKAKDYPVLGQDDIGGYEGFTYLYDEVLMTDSKENVESGKMEKQELTVYIPKDDYTTVDRSYARSSRLGVSVTVEIEPYLQYDLEDYLITESVQMHAETKYDPFLLNGYKDIVMGEPEKIGDDAARITAQYLNYNDYDDSYEAVFGTIYLKKLPSGVTVLVEVEVGESEATGKTTEIIDELQKFYDFTIDWDAEKAAAKREDYIASGGDNTFSTGYLIFELPEGWKMDNDYGDYTTKAFAPGGDVDTAGSMITFTDEYLGTDTFAIQDLLDNQDALNSYLANMFGESVKSLTSEAYGDTVLGEALKLDFNIEEGSEKVKMEMYLIVDEYDTLYAIQAAQLEGDSEDPFTVLEDILQNGQLREN